LRRDVACAVSGSGQIPTALRPNSSDPGRIFVDVGDAVPAIAQNRALRLFLVADPADKTVPVSQQTGFVAKLRQAGRHVPLLFGEATDPNHHGVVDYARLIVAGCALGKSDEQIAQAVGAISRKNAEYNQRRAKEAGNLAAAATPKREPALDRRAGPPDAPARNRI
jgi:hypothetical protein